MKRFGLSCCLFFLALAGCGNPRMTEKEPDEETPIAAVEEEVKVTDAPKTDVPPKTADPETPAVDPETPPTGVKTSSEIEDQVAAQNNDELIASLGDPQLATAASDELINRGAETVPTIAAALDDKNPAVVAQAIFTLGRFGKEAASTLPKLKSLAAESKDETVRDGARFAIDAIEESKPAKPE